MKKPVLTIFTLLLIIVSMLVTRSMVSNRLSASGTALDSINGKIESYETENVSLSEKLFMASSLTLVASEAAQIGFVAESSVYHMSAPLPIAVKQ